MTSLGLTAIMQIALMAPGAESYAEAHKATTETGRPMVVMVGADWCPACVQMKDRVLPQVREHGVLRKVAFAMVNLDQEQELGAQLTRGGPIPQLLMYRRTQDGWKLRRLIGGQDVQTIEGFIAEGIQLDETTKQAEKTTKPAAGGSADQKAASEAAPTRTGQSQPVVSSTKTATNASGG